MMTNVDMGQHTIIKGIIQQWTVRIANEAKPALHSPQSSLAINSGRQQP
jgi:hypothetical protein